MQVHVSSKDVKVLTNILDHSILKYVDKVNTNSERKMIKEMKFGIALCLGIIAIVFASSAFADYDKVLVISLKDEYNNRTVYIENPSNL